MNETDLILEMRGKGNILPPFSARECTQTLTPISLSHLHRTINGELVHIGSKEHRKFHSVISCKDRAAPAFDGLWKGSLLKVGCLQYLTQYIPSKSTRIQLERDALSLYLYDTSGKKWPADNTHDRWVTLPNDFPGGFITYRPSLLMLVKNFHMETDEWGTSVGWTLELEEQ